MKKIKLLGFILAFSLLVIGCSEDNVKETETHEDTIISNEDDENADNDDNEDEVDKNKNENNNVEGEELLETLDLSRTEKNISYKVKLTYGDNQESSITEVYLFYGNIKEVNETLEGRNVMIYNANEGKTYQYIEGDSNGTVFKSEDSGNQETSNTMTADDLEALFYSGELIEATSADYNGESVVYIETLDDTITTKIWFSTKFNIPLKTQMYEGDNLSYESEIYDIKRLGAGDDSIFIPPSNMEFVEFNIEYMEEIDDKMIEEENELN